MQGQFLQDEREQLLQDRKWHASFYIVPRDLTFEQPTKVSGPVDLRYLMIKLNHASSPKKDESLQHTGSVQFFCILAWSTVCMGMTLDRAVPAENIRPRKKKKFYENAPARNEIHLSSRDIA
ncbi:hypothetical protein EVG20_g8698 [Dentipellis fragilis]|uniref:Uncharacterized protein n=1 Tax=Dentipellis fragilis TaxID=205917 RepID=A0A4Y9Y6G2_9AGAM|nr:hypothetical protein EVG20_g8698 [Dentipellis fragilis]